VKNPMRAGLRNKLFFLCGHIYSKNKVVDVKSCPILDYTQQLMDKICVRLLQTLPIKETSKLHLGKLINKVLTVLIIFDAATLASTVTRNIK
jgi:hypothetical protein